MKKGKLEPALLKAGLSGLAFWNLYSLNQWQWFAASAKAD